MQPPIEFKNIMWVTFLRSRCFPYSSGDSRLLVIYGEHLTVILTLIRLRVKTPSTLALVQGLVSLNQEVIELCE